MTDAYLGRDGAPFGEDVWQTLDNAMMQAARDELAGRRLLHVEGPFGLELMAVPLCDTAVGGGISVSNLLPLAIIHSPFALGLRDLANYGRLGTMLDTRPLVDATVKAAQAEDGAVFNGAGGHPGLVNCDGAHEVELSTWDEPGTAADDLIRAVVALDVAGHHGPYALALSPPRYNLLYRRYPRGNQTEMDHLSAIATEGIVKAPALEVGGLLLGSRRQIASIVLGQDMAIQFIGPSGDGREFEFAVVESVAVHIRRPGAICVLSEPDPSEP